MAVLVTTLPSINAVFKYTATPPERNVPKSNPLTGLSPAVSWGLGVVKAEITKAATIAFH